LGVAAADTAQITAMAAASSGKRIVLNFMSSP
jgi:hypothetical protein